jgi:hypothetical protein
MGGLWDLTLLSVYAPNFSSFCAVVSCQRKIDGCFFPGTSFFTYNILCDWFWLNFLREIVN